MSGGNPALGAPSVTSFFYAGEYFDTDSQHYYNRVRWYNPLNGRFNRVDPFSGSPQDPQSLHKYLYVHCNPVNNIDPTGKMTLSQVVVGIGIGITVAGLSSTITGVLMDNPLLRDIGLGVTVVGLTMVGGGFLLSIGGTVAVIGAESVATSLSTGAASALITYAGALVYSYGQKVVSRNEYKKFVDSYTYSYSKGVSRKMPPSGMVILRDLGVRGIPVLVDIPNFSSGPPSYRTGDTIIAYSQQEDDIYKVKLTVYSVDNSGNLKRKFDTESTITGNPEDLFDPYMEESWTLIQN